MHTISTQAEEPQTSVEKIVSADSRFSPEVEMVLRCSATAVDVATACRIQSLARGSLDWNQVFSIALRHRTAPLIYRNLSRHCRSEIPADVCERFKQYCQGNARQSLLLTSELLKVLAVIEGEGIPVMPYKGPLLAARAYGDLALRDFIDLDILVHRSDFARAKVVLIAQGYAPLINFTAKQEFNHLHHEKDYPFIRRDGRIRLELHWQFTPGYFSLPLDYNLLWSRLERFPIAGRAVRSLPIEDLLVILCVHGTKHRWNRLSWICDLAELIRSNPLISWDRILAQTTMLGSGRMLATGLLLASDLLGAELPKRVRTHISHDVVALSVARQIRCRLFDANSVALESDGGAFLLRMRERWVDRVRHFLRLAQRRSIPTADDWALVPLPRFLGFVYYILRPIRLYRDHGIGPAKNLLKSLVTRG
jgi:hypothetical protein